jgi:hypothetical protein
MFNLPYRYLRSLEDANYNFNFLADDVEWNDINLPAAGLGQGASAPDLEAFLGTGSLKLLAFDGNATTEQVYGSSEILHDWKQGTDIEFHIHWSPTTNDTGNVKWQLEYSWCNINGTFDNPTTTSVVVAAGGTAWVHKVTAFPAISATGKNIGSALVFRFFRNPTDAADTYTKDATLIQLGIHYQIDSIGSKEKYSK